MQMTLVISEEDQHKMEEADFQAGEMIIEHISDSYDWHIIDFGDTTCINSLARYFIR